MNIQVLIHSSRCDMEMFAGRDGLKPWFGLVFPGQPSPSDLTLQHGSPEDVGWGQEGPGGPTLWGIPAGMGGP